MFWLRNKIFYALFTKGLDTRMINTSGCIFDIDVPWWQDLQIESLIENYYSYFSNITYVVGTQNNRLIETVILST